MPLFEIEEPEVDEIKAVGDAIIARANQINDNIVRDYRLAKEDFWHRPDWSVEKAQAVIDYLGPAKSLKVFQALAALGQVIATINPGALEESELSAPVSYTVDEVGRIVFDENGTYPGPIT